MITIDFSKAVPSRTGFYLLAIIPAAIFVMTIAAGNPALTQAVVDRVKGIYPFPSYGLLILFFASLFVIGQVFFLLSWFVEMLIRFAYVAKWYLLRLTLASQWLYRLFGKMQGIPPKRTLFIRVLSWSIFKARNRVHSDDSRAVRKCWRLVATELLKEKYHVDRSRERWDSPESEWEGWFALLGKRVPGLDEEFITMRALLSSGIAGLLAMYVEPALRIRYLGVVCAVFTFAGCYLASDLVKWRQDPVRRSLIRLRAVLLEMSDFRTAEGRNEQKGLSVTLKTDGGRADGGEIQNLGEED
jgi:hypothetical protein